MGFHHEQYRDRRRAVIDGCEALLFKSPMRTTPGGLGVLRSALNELVWKHSEATKHKGSKYLRCSYWSVGALKVYRRHRRDYCKYVHLDHVVPRKVLIDRLLAARTRGGIERVLRTNETCVLLRREHDQIRTTDAWRPDPKKPGGWWQRYAAIKRVRGPNVVEAQLDTRLRAMHRRPAERCVF